MPPPPLPAHHRCGSSRRNHRHHYRTTTTTTSSSSTRRKAIPRLGLDVPKAQLSADRLNQLFDEWDPDKSGRLSLAELVKKLRRCAAASER